MDIETISKHIENRGIQCEKRHRSYENHPELDYDFILCKKDELEFEISLEDSELLPVIKLVTCIEGKVFSLDRMLCQNEIDDHLIRYSVNYVIDFFLREVKNKQSNYEHY